VVAPPPRPGPVRSGWGRRLGAALVVLVVVVAAAACGGSSRHRSSPRPGVGPASSHPNIVFVLTDDLSANLVTERFMPNLWHLEHDGTRFTHYFVTDSLCCPSRASIFTGRYPHDTGVFNNSGPDGGISVFNARGDQNSTVATDLRRMGYRTAMMGKYLNKYQPQDAAAPGWDEWDVAGIQGYEEFDYDLNENGHLVHYGGPGAGKDNYLTDVLSGLADRFVQASTTGPRRSPFFLEVATYAPHTPYTPAPRYAGLYPGLVYPRTPAYGVANTDAPGWLAYEPPLSAAADALVDESFRKRAESVKSVDDMIGRLVATLERSGVWDNTYLVFSSDNGLHLGEHRLRPGKLTAFDTDINVPLIVVGPHVPSNRTVTAFTENIDLRPTFDSWAGGAPSEPVDGRSLEPLLAAAAPPSGWPQGILVEHHGPVGDPNDPDYPNRNSGNPTSYEALRLKGALYVEYADGEREYYDLDTDPFEIHNIYSRLAKSYVGELHAELVRVENCDDSPACSQITAPRP
jgi:N-acetylglucosamine-6-sulfatase